MSDVKLDKEALELAIAEMEKGRGMTEMASSHVARIIKAYLSHEECYDWVYDDDGEAYADAHEMADVLSLQPNGGYMPFNGASKICRKYIVNVPLTFDDNGDVDDSEYQIFETVEEAQVATQQPAEAKNGNR